MPDPETFIDGVFVGESCPPGLCEASLELSEGLELGEPDPEDSDSLGEPEEESDSLGEPELESLESLDELDEAEPVTGAFGDSGGWFRR